MKMSRCILKTGIFIALIFSAGCGRSNVLNLESRGENIICFGDSITRGLGVEVGESYPAYLAKMTNYPVINAGISSELSAEGLKRLSGDVLARHPLLVIIEFGGNDYMSPTTLGETIKNIEKMIKLIQAGGAMVAVVDISNIMFMGEYRQELERLSKKYQAIFIPRVLEDIVTNEKLKSDSIHPNAKGYKIIAYRVYRGIIPYLNQNALLRGSSGKLFDASKVFK